MNDREAQGNPGTPIARCGRSQTKLVLRHHDTGQVRVAAPGCGDKRCPICSQLWRRRARDAYGDVVEPYARVRVSFIADLDWPTFRRRFMRQGISWNWFAVEGGQRMVIASGGEGDEMRADKAIVEGLRQVDLTVPRSLGSGGAWKHKAKPSEWEAMGKTDAPLPELAAYAQRLGLLDEERSTTEGLTLQSPVDVDDAVGQRRWEAFLRLARVRPMVEPTFEGWVYEPQLDTG